MQSIPVNIDSRVLTKPVHACSVHNLGVLMISVQFGTDGAT